MSDKLYPLPLKNLLSWILNEEEHHNKILGHHKELFLKPQKNDVFRMERYGKLLETPIGVAAGPHTQLSQNIVLAWLFGARYLELKTVQTLDEIDVAKPCIDMEDEGYNCEWSQELKIKQSINEYLNAWIIIHILKDKFNWSAADNTGFIFNMSVGYDLKGILNANVQEYFKLMGNCEQQLAAKIDEISKIYPKVNQLNIPKKLTDNITLSTMHGCPPEEIEKIGKYLIEELKLHTTIKLNPTLLGPDRLRQILNNDLKFSQVIVPDEAFEHDLKYDDSIKLIKNLKELANPNKVDFGLKLTNTLEVLNTRSVLPKKEATNYMSGRALHPISINLAQRLQSDFNGELDISFSAGADCFNISNILACNIKPVTTCTDVLKPGGYGRLIQYLENINTEFISENATNIDEYILIKGGKTDVPQSGFQYLTKYAKDVIKNSAYQKEFSEFDSIKTNRKLTEFDCIKAPCIGNCATDQHIPQYIYHVAKGEIDEAFDVIMQTNPLPGITGAVCDQLCAIKCTRQNYDNPLLIRDIKRYAAEVGNLTHNTTKKTNKKLKIAIIGAGPAGLSCAYFLAQAGSTVEIFEAKPYSGGMVFEAIPKFRLDYKAYFSDVHRILDLGVKFNYDSVVNAEKFDELREQYNYVFIGVGAQKNKKLHINGENLKNVLEPVEFLAKVKLGGNIKIGKNVAIIGGGNTAMDAARTAKRLVGKNGEVTILYRRTRKEMPAEDAEIQAAINEGIKLIELVSPVKINGTEKVISLTCNKMKLGKPDSSGRARPIEIPNSEFDIVLDTIIPAIGQDIIMDFLGNAELKPNLKTCATNLSKVYAGGDAIRGAATVVEAVGDGQVAAKNILLDAKSKEFSITKTHKNITDLELQHNIIRREYGIQIPKNKSEKLLNFDLIHRTMTREEVMEEAERCLYCDEICSMCVYVCPNLANLAYKVDPLSTNEQIVVQKDKYVRIAKGENINFEQTTQIINIRDFCNECGNCTTFCPTDGEPYRIKPKFHLRAESFAAEPDGYRFKDSYLQYKSNGSIELMKFEDDHLLFSNKFLSAILDKSSLQINKLHSKIDDDFKWSSRSAVHMGYLLLNLQKEAIFAK